MSLKAKSWLFLPKCFLSFLSYLMGTPGLGGILDHFHSKISSVPKVANERNQTPRIKIRQRGLLHMSHCILSWEECIVSSAWSRWTLLSLRWKAMLVCWLTTTPSNCKHSFLIGIRTGFYFPEWAFFQARCSTLSGGVFGWHNWRG